MALNTLLAAAALAAVGQQAEPTNFVFQSKLKSLAVFQQGFGYYVREGRVKLEGGVANTNLVPVAAAGTYGVFSVDPRVKLDTLFVSTDNRLAFKDAADLRKKLADKIGLDLTIATKNVGVKQGVLFSLIDEFVLLKAADGNLIPVRYEDCVSVSLAAYPIRILLEAPNPNGDVTLGLAYVQQGVQWSPSYELEMISEDRGVMRLRGTLLGITEDLDAADLTFVVGTPQLSGLYQLDPLFVGVQSGLAFRPDQLRHVSADPGMSAPAMAAGPPPGPGGGGFGGEMAAEMANQAGTRMDSSGELFYYTKPKFTMRQGERALVTFFETEIPVETRFEWWVDQGAVTFILNLKNTSDKAFAGGPVFVTKERRPIGMQQIEPAPPGGEAELRLATGVGLRTDRKERVIDSVREDINVNGVRGTRTTTTIEGRLTIESLRDLPSQVKVTKRVVGSDVTAEGAEVIFLSQERESSSFDVVWDIVVPKREKAELIYTYKVITSVRAMLP